MTRWLRRRGFIGERAEDEGEEQPAPSALVACMRAGGTYARMDVDAPESEELELASIGPLSCGVSIWSTSCPASGGRRALLADTDAASVAAILAHLGLATEPPLVARARDPSADAA